MGPFLTHCKSFWGTMSSQWVEDEVVFVPFEPTSSQFEALSGARRDSKGYNISKQLLCWYPVFIYLDVLWYAFSCVCFFYLSLLVTIFTLSCIIALQYLLELCKPFGDSLSSDDSLWVTLQFTVFEQIFKRKKFGLKDFKRVEALVVCLMSSIINCSAIKMLVLLFIIKKDFVTYSLEKNNFIWYCMIYLTESSVWFYKLFLKRYLKVTLARIISTALFLLFFWVSNK